MMSFLLIAIVAIASFALGFTFKKKPSGNDNLNTSNQNKQVQTKETEQEFDLIKKMPDEKKIEYLNQKLKQTGQFKIDFETMYYFAKNFGDRIKTDGSDLNTFTINVIEEFEADRQKYNENEQNLSRQIIEQSKKEYELQKARFLTLGGVQNIYMEPESTSSIINLYFDERLETEWHTSKIGTKCVRISKDELLELTEELIVKLEYGQTRFIIPWRDFTEMELQGSADFDFLRKMFYRLKENKNSQSQEQIANTDNSDIDKQNTAQSNDDEKIFKNTQKAKDYEVIAIDIIHEQLKTNRKFCIKNSSLKNDIMINVELFFDAFAKRFNNSNEVKLIIESDMDDFLKDSIFTKIIKRDKTVVYFGSITTRNLENGEYFDFKFARVKKPEYFNEESHMFDYEFVSYAN